MAKKIKKTYKELAIEFKKTKDEKVYNELYAKMRPGLWSYVNNIVKDPHVADDIVSTTLTTVYLKIEQYNEDYQITTWAYRIAYNECIGWIRYRNRKVSMNIFTDKTKKELKTRIRGKIRQDVGKDTERHEIQKSLLKSKGISEEPIILFKTKDGKYELGEGWHRTTQTFIEFPDGFIQPNVYIGRNAKWLD